MLNLSKVTEIDNGKNMVLPESGPACPLSVRKLGKIKILLKTYRVKITAHKNMLYLSLGKLNQNHSCFVPLSCF